MQIRTVENYQPKTGRITGFCEAPSEYLELIIKDLGLLMSQSAISYIQNHFKAIEKREPDVSELIMLDILMCNAYIRASEHKEYELAELTTDSEEIKNTFSDMMGKLSAIEPKRKGPVPFKSLMNLSGSYILSLMPEKYERKNVNPIEIENIKHGVYIQIEKNENIPLLIENLSQKGIKYTSRVITDNIIEEILGETDHAEITVPFSLPHLATFGEGDLLILCHEENEQEIVYAGNGLGLRMRRAGKKLKKGCVSFKNPAFEYSLNQIILKNATDAQKADSVKICIPDELINKPGHCELISKEKVAAEIDIDSVSTVSSSSFVSPYKDGIAQVICAAAGSIAEGTPSDEIKMTHLIDCPLNTDPAALIAHIMGIYRAEAELCIYSSDNKIRIASSNEKSVSCSISVSPQSAKGGFGEGSLWLVSPQNQNNEPCFENIRKTFSYMTELIASGHTIRACALDTEGISVEDMFSANGSEAKKEQSANIGSFLVLTNAELIPADGIITEKIGAVGMEESVNSDENMC